MKFARQKKGAGPGNLMIKNWTPLHESVVQARISGKSNTEIALEYNLGEASVSVICNSHQAKSIIREVTNRIREEGIENLPEARKAMIIKAYERMQDFMNNDTLASAAPFQHVSQTVKILEVLQASERKEPDPTGVTNNYQFNILNDPEKRDGLREGLERARLAAEVNAHIGGNSFDNTVKDVVPEVDNPLVLKLAK